MVEKQSARYLYPISTDSSTRDTRDLGYGFRRGEDTRSRHIETGGYVLDYLETDDATSAAIRLEAAGWQIRDRYYYSYENDDRDISDSETNIYTHEIADMASISSPVYSGFRGDILVIDGHFAGVVLETGKGGGNGWTGERVGTYCILFADGTVLGSNVISEGFSGESISRYTSDTYTLVKKETKPA